MKSQGMEQVRQETESPPSRGAWIEICVWGGARMTHTVAPLAGGVD